MERLNKIQLKILRETNSKHPNNRIKFFDAVSTIHITSDYRRNEEKHNFLREMTKIPNLDIDVRMPNA